MASKSPRKVSNVFDENYHEVYLSPEQVCCSNPASMVLILLTTFVPVHFNHLFLWLALVGNGCHPEKALGWTHFSNCTPASSHPALPPRHPTTDWAEYAAIQSSRFHISTHERPVLANLWHPWHLHAPFPTNLDQRGPLWSEKRGSKVAAAISLFVYLDLRWRQGLWRACAGSGSLESTSQWRGRHPTALKSPWVYPKTIKDYLF